MDGWEKGKIIWQGFNYPVFACGGEIMAGILAVTGATELHAEYKAWLEKHPLVKPKSDEEREKLAARMRRLRGIPS